MKVAIYNGEKDIIIKEIDIPKCGDNDILIKNIYASICGSDISAYFHGPREHRISKGMEFGHEVVSRVVEVGKNVKDINVGDRVYPYPLLARGDTSRAGTLGGFSEYILIPNCELNKQVYKVPDDIPSKVASLIEPFTVGTRAARRARPQEGENAIVYGCGTIGIAAAIALKYFKCNKVMIVDLVDSRLEIASKMGFYTCNSSEEDVIEKAKEVFGTAKCLKGDTANIDIWIDAVGAPTIMEQYQEKGKIFSRIVVVGVHQEPQPIKLVTLAYSQQEIIGSGGYMPEDVIDVMKIMQSKQFDIESIITHEYKQEQIIDALEMAGKTDESLNVVIKYE